MNKILHPKNYLCIIFMKDSAYSVWSNDNTQLCFMQETSYLTNINDLTYIQYYYNFGPIFSVRYSFLRLSITRPHLYFITENHYEYIN